MVGTEFGREDDGKAPRRSPWSRGWRLLAGTAVVVLIGITAFAVVAAASPSGTAKRTTTPAEVTAAHRSTTGGRSGFVAGTVASVNGAMFTVTVTGSTSPKTVTTSSSTTFTLTTAGTVADASVGRLVVAEGTRSANGNLAATELAILPAHNGGDDGGSGSGKDPGPDPEAVTPALKGDLGSLSHLPFVFGTVTANAGGSLTVSTPFGAQTVTTSTATMVTKTVSASLAAVTSGALVEAAGVLAHDGALGARFVHLGSPPIHGVTGTVAGGRTSGAAAVGSSAPTISTTAGRTSTTVTTKPRPGFATGRVATLTGSGFSLQGAGSSSPKTVTTSSATQFTMTGPGTVANAAVGTFVLVSGERQMDGTLAATKLTILPAVAHAAAAAASPPGGFSGIEGLPVVFGTVTANAGGTLSVTTPFGSQTVNTSAATAVTATTIVTRSAVTVGAVVQVAGTVAPDGSLVAQFVHVGSVTLGLDAAGTAEGIGHPGSGSGEASGTSPSGGN